MNQPERLPQEETAPIYENKDLIWEEKKWQIPQTIKEKLNRRYPEHSVVTYTGAEQKQPLQESSSLSSTICIMPAIITGRQEGIDSLTTRYIIEELTSLFVSRPDWVVVERVRLDFVLHELDTANSNLSKSKLKFALGQILGARGILFVRSFKQPSRIPYPFTREKTDVFLRYVETQTSAINATAGATLTHKDVKTVSRRLGQEILLSLQKR